MYITLLYVLASRRILCAFVLTKQVTSYDKQGRLTESRNVPGNRVLETCLNLDLANNVHTQARR